MKGFSMNVTESILAHQDFEHEDMVGAFVIPMAIENAPTPISIGSNIVRGLTNDEIDAFFSAFFVIDYIVWDISTPDKPRAIAWFTPGGDFTVTGNATPLQIRIIEFAIMGL